MYVNIFIAIIIIKIQFYINIIHNADDVMKPFKCNNNVILCIFIFYISYSRLFLLITLKYNFVFSIKIDFFLSDLAINIIRNFNFKLSEIFRNYVLPTECNF